MRWTCEATAPDDCGIPAGALDSAGQPAVVSFGESAAQEIENKFGLTGVEPAIEGGEAGEGFDHHSEDSAAGRIVGAAACPQAPEIPPVLRCEAGQIGWLSGHPQECSLMPGASARLGRKKGVSFPANEARLPRLCTDCSCVLDSRRGGNNPHFIQYHA